jgi:hypothetical protein
MRLGGTTRITCGRPQASPTPRPKESALPGRSVDLTGHDHRLGIAWARVRAAGALLV